MIHFPFAYVGPGAGFAFLGSLLSLLLSLVAGLASLLLWPFRALFGFFRRSVRARVILLEVDGLDPQVLGKVMADGRQPSLWRLAAPVSAPWRAAAFWEILGEHAVDSTVLLVPGTYPPKAFKGRMLYRASEGQVVSRPPYYAKYLSRLLGAPAEALQDAEALFFSALDHQKRGVIASVFEVQADAADDVDRIIRRMLEYADRYTTIFIVFDQGALFSSRRFDDGKEIGPTVLGIFGIDVPDWMEGKPVIPFA